MSWVPRYWALIILSVVYRLGGVLLLGFTILSVFAFVAVADNTGQPIVFPTLAPFPTFPPFPDFSFSSPPPLPFPTNPSEFTTQLSQAFGAFAAVFILVTGLVASIGLFALGQFLVMMIDIEYDMYVTAHGLETRLRRRS